MKTIVAIMLALVLGITNTRGEQSITETEVRSIFKETCVVLLEKFSNNLPTEKNSIKEIEELQNRIDKDDVGDIFFKLKDVTYKYVKKESPDKNRDEIERSTKKILATANNARQKYLGFSIVTHSYLFYPEQEENIEKVAKK